MKYIVKECSSPLSLFFCGCMHLGSYAVDWDKLREQLKECRKKKSRIIFPGDVFDAIMPSDPRSMASGLDPRLARKTNLIDASIDLAFKILKPYADLIDVIGDGNHEWQLNKRHSTNICARLVDKLNDACGTDITYGGILFYVLYVMKVRNNTTRTFRVLCFHGKGGESPTTKGIGDVARMRSKGYVYDLYVTAHKHSSFATPDIWTEPYIANTGEGRGRATICKALQVSTFKMGSLEQDVNSRDVPPWEELRAFAPPVTGGNFVDVKCVRKEMNRKASYNFDIKVIV